MTFDEWWMRMKPAECDELKEVFIECWQMAFAAGEAFEREGCAKACEAEAVDASVSPEDAAYNAALKHAADAIRLRSNYIYTSPISSHAPDNQSEHHAAQPKSDTE